MKASLLRSKITNLQTLIKKKSDAEAANHAKGEFLATINHEMRTPLNGILGMVEMLQLKPSTAEQKEQLEHLDGASRQLAGLVDDVLDFSKIDKNLVVVQAKDFSSLTLVQDLTGLFSLSAKQKGIGFSVQLKPGVSQWLRGDMLHLEQVLNNLISNAIKFTEQGEVCLTIGLVHESRSLRKHQNNLITFEVSDTGIGIEPTQLEHIFSPYYQIEGQSQSSLLKTTNLGNSGTGLGLAISEGLAIAMGGSIKATSVLGQGSRFFLTLPLPSGRAPHQDLETESLDAAHSSLTGINILLVEDSPINQRVMTAFLQETGAKITIFDTGTSAINHFKDHGADIILMDYRLPDTNGLAASQTIREYEHLNGYQECPIIMHTADNRVNLSDKTQLAGIDQLLPKPFTQAQLINIIIQALETNSLDACAPLKPNTNPKLLSLFDDFVDQSFATLQQSRSHLIARDYQAFKEELHKCVGSAGLFGADELYQTILDIEAHSVTESFDTEVVSTLLKRAEQQLKGYRMWSKGSA